MKRSEQLWSDAELCRQSILVDRWNMSVIAQLYLAIAELSKAALLAEAQEKEF